MFSSRKATELTIGLIVTIAIALLVLVIYFFFIKGGVESFERGTSCEAYGHVLAKECNEASSIQNKLFAKDKEGLICCMPKPGEKTAFEDWKKTIVPSGTTGDGTGDEDDSGTDAIIDFENAPLSNTNYLVPRDEVPNYPEAGRTESVPGVNNAQGVAYLEINGKIIETGLRTNEIYPGKVPISAKNNYKTSAECYVNIREIPPEGKLLSSTKQNKYIKKPCDKHNKLEFTATLKPNTKYKLNFGVLNAQGEPLSSAMAYVLTNDLEQPETASPEPEIRTIDINPINYVSRKNQNYAFISPVLTGPGDPRDIRMYGFVESKGGLCGSQPIERFQAYNEISVSPENQVCVIFTIPEKDNYASYVTPTKIITGVDKVVILNGESYPLYFEDCTLTCDDFSRSLCKDHTMRQTACQYSVDCFWSETNEYNSGRFCDDCAGVVNCEDLNTQSACEENQCISTKCVWDEAAFLGEGACDLAE